MQEERNNAKMTSNTTEIMRLPGPVKFVLGRLEKNGFHAYAVGGCVRDHLMGRVPGDYDVTTNALPEEMLRVFSDCRVVETGLKHGTLTVVREGMNIETTTYRIDGTYDDGRHPDSVTFTDKLSDDLMRRDFTINAMAYSPARGIVDLYGGRDDLQKKTVRCVGCAADRFSEDGLRILRALRFSSVLGFTPDKECSDAVISLTHLLGKISRERIWAELGKLLCGQNCSEILSAYPTVIAFVLPQLCEDHVKSAAEKIAALDRLYPGHRDLCLRCALLFSDIAPDKAAAAVDSLKTSRDEKRRILDFIKHRTAFAEDCSAYTIKKLISRTHDAFPSDLAVFLSAEGSITKDTADLVIREEADIISRGECRSLTQLMIGGNDLISLGLRGQAIGSTLAALLDAVMRGECANERGELEAKAREMNEECRVKENTAIS